MKRPYVTHQIEAYSKYNKISNYPLDTSNIHGELILRNSVTRKLFKKQNFISIIDEPINISSSINLEMDFIKNNNISKHYYKAINNVQILDGIFLNSNSSIKRKITIQWVPPKSYIQSLEAYRKEPVYFNQNDCSPLVGISINTSNNFPLHLQVPLDCSLVGEIYNSRIIGEIYDSQSLNPSDLNSLQEYLTDTTLSTKGLYFFLNSYVTIFNGSPIKIYNEDNTTSYDSEIGLFKHFNRYITYCNTEFPTNKIFFFKLFDILNDVQKSVFKSTYLEYFSLTSIEFDELFIHNRKTESIVRQDNEQEQDDSFYYGGYAKQDDSVDYGEELLASIDSLRGLYNNIYSTPPSDSSELVFSNFLNQNKFLQASDDPHKHLVNNQLSKKEKLTPMDINYSAKISDIIQEFNSYRTDLVKMMERPLLADLGNEHVKKFYILCEDYQLSIEEGLILDRNMFIIIRTEFNLLMSYVEKVKLSIFSQKEKQKIIDASTFLDKALNDESTENEKTLSAKAFIKGLEGVLPVDESAIEWLKIHSGMLSLEI